MHGFIRNLCVAPMKPNDVLLSSVLFGTCIRQYRTCSKYCRQETCSFMNRTKVLMNVKHGFMFGLSSELRNRHTINSWTGILHQWLLKTLSEIGITSTFLLYFSMNYRDFSVKSKLIISLFQTVRLSLSISLFQKTGFS